MMKRGVRFSLVLSASGIDAIACLDRDPAALDEVARVMRKVRREAQAFELAVRRAYESWGAKASVPPRRKLKVKRGDHCVAI